MDADHLRFRLKTPWSDGTTHLVLSPLELIEKLAALVPPPRLNLVRYHGILALNAGFRRLVVPGSSVSPGASSVGCSSVSRFRRRLVGGVLARVLAVDVTLCPACGGRRNFSGKRPTFARAFWIHLMARLLVLDITTYP